MFPSPKVVNKKCVKEASMLAASMAASVPYRIFPGVQPYQRTILELKCSTKIFDGMKDKTEGG
jgi:hypothetical protein